MTNAEAVIFAAGTTVPFGSQYTEAVPATAGQGAIVGAFADYACGVAWRILNKSTAPGTPLTLVIYGVRADGALHEIDRVTGTTNGSTTETSAGILPPSGVIPCPPGFSKFTARAFGNTSNDVGVEAFLMRQVP